MDWGVFRRRRLKAAAIACLAMMCSGGLAHAQVIVLQSTSPGLKNGQMLERSSRLAIAEGESVTVVLPSGETRTIAGPFEAPTADLTRGIRSDPAVFDAVRSFVERSQPSGNLGRVRSMATRAPNKISPVSAPNLKFSWRDIPISATGDICVEKGAELSLVRGASGQPRVVTVVNMNSAQRVRVRFGPPDVRISWPEDLRPENGSFAILSPKQPMRQIRLRLLEPLPTADQTLRVLHGQRCKLQFQAYLRGVMVAQK